MQPGDPKCRHVTFASSTQASPTTVWHGSHVQMPLIGEHTPRPPQMAPVPSVLFTPRHGDVQSAPKKPGAQVHTSLAKLPAQLLSSSRAPQTVSQVPTVQTRLAFAVPASQGHPVSLHAVPAQRTFVAESQLQKHCPVELEQTPLP
jgi:hypothetical protein